MGKGVQYRVIPVLLVICIVFGTLSGTGMAAGGPQTINVQDEISLKDAIEELSGTGGTILIDASRISISEPIKISSKQSITITSNASVSPTLSAKESASWEIWRRGIFHVTSGANVTLENLVVDGNSMTRGIFAQDDSTTVTLDNVVVKNGNSGGDNGGGICMGGGIGSVLTVQNGCQFIGNEITSAVPVGGGAIYAGPSVLANIYDSSFQGNKAHSGACIYSYLSHVFVAHCTFGPSGSNGDPGQATNVSGQRGGALHCHGTMVVKDCTISGNVSEQYGGGVYVSSSESYQGMVLLDNTTIRNNTAQNGGGGVFLASGGSLFLAGNSSVTDNHLSSTALSIEGENNNVYYSGESGKIIACSDALGPVGVSTVSPIYRKLSVYSLGTISNQLYDDLNNRLSGKFDKNTCANLAETEK